MRRHTLWNTVGALVASIGLLWLPNAVSASPVISIIEGPNESDGISVVSSGFDSAPMIVVSSTATSEFVEASGAFLSPLLPASLHSEFRAYLLEDALSRAISDVITIRFVTSPAPGHGLDVVTIFLTFQSDGEGPLGFLADGLPALVENGQLQLLDGVVLGLTKGKPPSLEPTGGWPAGLSISAQSPTEAIPEPSTLALLGAGLAGLGAVRRRKARKNT